MYDIAVIGGGPAGLSAALYALRAGKKTVIFEGNALGGTLNSLEKIENYPGFKSLTGPALTKKMTAQVMRFKPAIVKQFVISVTDEGDFFSLLTNTEEFQAKRVIYCGGMKRTTLKAAENFKGEGISYCATCDGYFYRGKTVAVLGSGYTAEEDVHYLLPLCKKVYLIGSVESLKDKVEQIEGKIKRLIGEEHLTALELADGRTIEVDGLFIALGGGNDAEAILGYPVKEGRLAKRLYVAGDAGTAFKQIVWACATGAKAATDALKE